MPGKQLAIVKWAFLILATLFIKADLQAQGSRCHDRPCGPDSIPPALRFLIPQGVAGADFRGACRAHDRCYAKGSGRCKSDCDCEFLHNMLRECNGSRNPRRCRRRAKCMYRLVRNFGGSSFGT